jgi:hypothetical protein
MANAKDLTPLIEELCAEMHNNSKQLVDALYWIGEEASPQSNGLNLTDALVGIARGLYAVADAINNKKPEAKAPVADVRPGDFRL